MTSISSYRDRMKEGEDITAAERVNKLVSEAEVTEEISLHSNMVAVVS